MKDIEDQVLADFDRATRDLKAHMVRARAALKRSFREEVKDLKPSIEDLPEGACPRCATYRRTMERAMHFLRSENRGAEATGKIILEGFLTRLHRSGAKGNNKDIRAFWDALTRFTIDEARDLEPELVSRWIDPTHIRLAVPTKDNGVIYAEPLRVLRRMNKQPWRKS